MTAKRWIKWEGGSIPCGWEDLIDVKLRDGTIMTGEMAGDFSPLSVGETPANSNWMHDGGDLDIVAYRVTERRP